MYNTMYLSRCCLTRIFGDGMNRVRDINLYRVIESWSCFECLDDNAKTVIITIKLEEDDYMETIKPDHEHFKSLIADAKKEAGRNMDYYCDKMRSILNPPKHYEELYYFYKYAFLDLNDMLFELENKIK